MEPLRTKAEIVSWYEKAKKMLELRKAGKSPVFPGVGLSEQDYEAYRRSIELHFLRLKRAHNRRIDDERAKSQKLSRG